MTADRVCAKKNSDRPWLHILTLKIVFLRNYDLRHKVGFCFSGHICILICYIKTSLFVHVLLKIYIIIVKLHC